MERPEQRVLLGGGRKISISGAKHGNKFEVWEFVAPKSCLETPASMKVVIWLLVSRKPSYKIFFYSEEVKSFYNCPTKKM